MRYLARALVAGCALAAVLVFNGTTIRGDEELSSPVPSEENSSGGSGDPTLRPIDRADNAWMLTSSALVLMMTAPGLAMFYGGLVRKKNVLGVMMQCMFLMGLMTVIWAIYGYSLAFGGDPAAAGAPEVSRWIGNADHLFLKGVAAEWRDGKAVIPTQPSYNIPWLTHMLFQGMFFIITPALICGAFAERMKFSAMVVFMILWGTLVYLPLAIGFGAAEY